jgi:hypothetical protein
VGGLTRRAAAGRIACMDPRSRYCGLAYLLIGLGLFLLVHSWGAPLSVSTFPLGFLLWVRRLRGTILQNEAALRIP